MMYQWVAGTVCGRPTAAPIHIWTFVILSPLIAVVPEDHSGLLASHAAHLVGGLANHAAMKVAAVIRAVQSLIT